MKYLLKANGYFELVNKYTFDNHKFALADDGSPRYSFNEWVIVNDNGQLNCQLIDADPADLAILVRGLDLPAAPAKIEGGFIREPVIVKFQKGRSVTMLELKTGEMWTRKAA